MRTAGKLMGIAAVLGCLSGCEEIAWGPANSPKPAARRPNVPPGKGNPRGPEYLVGLAVKEADGPGGGVAAAQAAREKYLGVAEDLLASQKANSTLTDENKKLLAQAARLEMRLEQSQKELTEANDAIVEMNKSLREWKRDVLGRHGQTQASLQALLEAQKKILILLGGEVTREKPKPTGKAAVSSKETAGEASNTPKG